jgi:nitronate monooxygenase
MDRATRFAASLGLRFPIFAAPVGSVAGPELAAAVSQAGGLGALALTWTSWEDTQRSVAEVQKRTQNPFQANFVLAFEPKSLRCALEAGVRVVTFSWGIPAEEVALVRSYGASYGVQVTTIDGAKRALDIGADFLICQGVEAGGHVQATRSLWEILPQIISIAQTVPVVASGGIGNGKGIARALSIGASGAMLGTRFVATRESLAHELYKRKLVEAKTEDAVLTVCFDLGWPYAAHRVLGNSTLAMWEAAGCPPSGRRPGEGDRTATDPTGRSFLRYQDVPPRVGMTGDVEAMSLFAGLSCGDIRDIPSTKELIERLWQECESEWRLIANKGVEPTR